MAILGIAQGFTAVSPTRWTLHNSLQWSLIAQLAYFLMSDTPSACGLAPYPTIRRAKQNSRWIKMMNSLIVENFQMFFYLKFILCGECETLLSE